MQTTFTTFTCTTKFVPLISISSDEIPKDFIIKIDPGTLFIEGYGYVSKKKLGIT